MDSSTKDTLVQNEERNSTFIVRKTILILNHFFRFLRILTGYCKCIKLIYQDRKRIFSPSLYDEATFYQNICCRFILLSETNIII